MYYAAGLGRPGRFGHQEGVTAIDALSRERCITSGGRDRSARLWKVAEESQLLYKGQAASMDTVRWVSDDAFVSGDDEGYVSRRGCKHENAKTKTHKITNPHARRLRGAHAETCAFGMSTRKRRQ